MYEYSYTRACGIHPAYLIWDQLSDEQRQEVQKFEREQIWTQMVRKVEFDNTIYDIPEGMQYSIKEYTLPIPFLKIKYKKIFFSCRCGWEFEAPRSEKQINCPTCKQVIKVSK